MLIVPVENRPDWKTPPVATLLLILVNVLVFFGYQAKDPQRIEAAYRWYSESNLLARERGPFLQYVKRTSPQLLEGSGAPAAADGGGDDETTEGVQAQSSALDQLQFQYALSDQDFIQALQLELGGDTQWQADRKKLERLADSISIRAYGFIPADARWDTWFTSMFLHVNFEHLLGNMVFLFLFGFALEIAIGRPVFLLLYILSGLGGGVLYWAAEMGSHGAAVGASGAISGLMGMYIAVYGLRRINFFYSVIFYAGHFRAPALIVFPVWVGYELLGAWRGGDGVGHWAHSGGLLFGFVLLALWLRFGLKYNRDYVEKIDHDAPWKAAVARLQELMAAMKLPEAREQGMQLVAAYPQEAQVWRALYDVVKISPSSREYHQVAHGLFKQIRHGIRNPALKSLIEDVAHDYIRLGGKAPALTESVALELAQRMGRSEHVEPFVFLVDRLLALNSQHETMPRILLAAVNLSAKSGNPTLAQRYRDELLRRFPRSEEARQVLG